MYLFVYFKCRSNILFDFLICFHVFDYGSFVKYCYPDAINCNKYAYKIPPSEFIVLGNIIL